MSLKKKAFSMNEIRVDSKAYFEKNYVKLSDAEEEINELREFMDRHIVTSYLSLKEVKWFNEQMKKLNKND